VIPLPEASELMVKLRRRESEASAVRGDGRDWTAYVIDTPGGRTEPLRKRRAIQTLVSALVDIGVAPAKIATVLPPAKFLSVPGTFTSDELPEVLAQHFPRMTQRRYFLDTPLHGDKRTWLLSKMWGPTTEAVLADLAALAPVQGFGYEAQPRA
jgi:hypothetical protein